MTTTSGYLGTPYYGVDYYGLSKYGEIDALKYNVHPFVARPVSHDEIALTWRIPHGTLQRFRLIRNKFGYAQHENDGDLLIDSAVSPSSWVDSKVYGGRYYYYTIWVLTADQWIPAGGASVLMPADHGYTRQLLDLVPHYYRYDTRVITEYADENQLLKKFLAIFGWGFDQLHTHYAALSRLNDPRHVSAANLRHLAEQFGLPLDDQTDSKLLRQYVANNGVLLREKGSEAGLRNLINVASGFDAVVQTSGNIMLDQDDSIFLSVPYPEWSPDIRYAVGERIKYKGVYWQAIVSAQGLAQAPSGVLTGTDHLPVGTDNTWWAFLRDVTHAAARNGSTGGLFSWNFYSLTAGVSLTTASSRVIAALASPISTGNNYVTALQLTNTSLSTISMAARSVGRLTGDVGMDPRQPITDGIPLRHARRPYDATRDYDKGELALYDGRAYRARQDIRGVAPGAGRAQTPEWERVGVDQRIRYCFSAYLAPRKPGADLTTWPAVTATPVIDWYDELGQLITSVRARSTGAVQFDSFSDDWQAAWPGRVPDSGATWPAPVGAWSASSYQGGVAVATAVGRNITVVSGPANTKVAMTFRTAPPAGIEQGLALRYTDASNYIRATRTKLQTVVAGVVTTVGDYSGQAFQDNDRMVVTLNGQAIDIRRNGVLVMSAGIAFNATATLHGMLVE